jgi:hypothetical protein
MKTFIRRILLYILPILLIAVALEIFIRHIPNDYIYKKEYLDAHAGEINTLILGASHALYGIDPVYFSSNTFNVSNVSQTLNYDYEILKKYDEKLVRLKTVVIPVSYPTLWSKLESGDESWRTKNYSIYYEIKNKKIPLRYHFEVSGFDLKTNIKRVISYLKEGEKLFSSKYGWGTDFHSEKAQDLQETAQSAVLRHTAKNLHSRESEENLKDNKRIIESIIQICNKHNADILFLTPPVYETYRQLLNKEQLDTTIKTIDEITKECSHCTYINLISDSSFTAADFYDADHLSEIGAKKLSLFIDSLIEKTPDSSKR